MRSTRTLLAILFSLAASSAWAEEEPAGELLHSEQPFWRPGTDKVWPQAFSDAESFGCAHRLSLGIWRFDEAGSDVTGEAWFDFANYGVFHCWMNVSEGPERDELGDSRPGFLIDLGVSAAGRELWVLQLGARPGSEYLLLARDRQPESIRQFQVLQRACPAGRVRGGPSLDILSTRYCSLVSRAELIALAKRMAKRPPLGTLSFVEAKPDRD